MIAVLFSGGVDSLGCMYWAVEEFGLQQVQAIYINVGQSYYQKEYGVASALCRECFAQELVTAKVDNLIEDELTGHIPLRNLMLILTAVQLGADGVVFGMLKGEASEDKNPRFVRRVQTLLDSQFVTSPYRPKKKPFKIYVPFAEFTKAQVVRYLIANGRTQEILRTVGCYSPFCNCGECLGCLNRWVALELNGLAEMERYRIHPFLVVVDHLKGRKKLPIAESKLGLSVLMSRLGKYKETFKAATLYCRRTYGTSFVEYLRRG